ncbi:MAG TPA: hypothetical protein DDW21_01885 [Verrucomicrobiales bacterium]|nr:hypothetical protein [Verrucomicrobiales bacterium]
MILVKYGGEGGQPSCVVYSIDFIGFIGSLVSPGSAERQESTPFFVRNSSEKLPFFPGLVDGFETIPTGTGVPEIRELALLVKYLSIRHTSARSVPRIKVIFITSASAFVIK